MVYHSDSVVCKAAIHAGLLPASGGEVKIEIANGLESYESVLSNAIHSLQFDLGTRSFVIHKDDDEVTTLTCTETAATEDIASKPIDQTVYVKCPENCAGTDVPVYGNLTYSEDSSVCLAGMHYGIIGDKGGEFKILITGDQSKFIASSANGV